MALVAGPNVLRMAPSLVIPEADIAEGMARSSGPSLAWWPTSEPRLRHAGSPITWRP